MRSTDGREPLRLRPLELASGIVTGPAPGGGSRPGAAGAASPRDALEAAILPALHRPPCVVSFSGGMDSSLVLGVAARLAAREGLPLPVPVTIRVPTAPAAEESWWQRLVVQHAGLLEQWLELEFAEGDLDWIGPIAGPVLRSHGVLWPANAFFHAPILERARGGSLLTGVGGDDVLKGWNGHRAAQVLARRARPRPRDALRVGLALAPRAVRAAALARRFDPPSWLAPAPRGEVVRRWAAEEAAEPWPWDRRVAWVEGRRVLAATRGSLGRLAAETDTLIAHPLIDPSFIRALGKAGGRAGIGDRSAIFGAIAGDALPDRLLLRPDKALFHEVLWSSRFRSFAREWAGEGLDRSLVDVRGLAAEWAGEVPHVRSALLLQAAWLSTQGGQGVDDPSKR